MSLATRMIREESPCFNWKHTHYFHPDTLSLILKDQGFELLHMETVITEIDNIKSFLNWQHPYSGSGDPENIFSHITPEYIHKNLMGSRIIAIAKRQ